MTFLGIARTRMRRRHHHHHPPPAFQFTTMWRRRGMSQKVAPSLRFIMSIHPPPCSTACLHERGRYSVPKHDAPPPPPPQAIGDATGWQLTEKKNVENYSRTYDAIEHSATVTFIVDCPRRRPPCTLTKMRHVVDIR